jgi:alpha-galactosidase
MDLGRGSEYAASVFNAVFGDHTVFEFNGNVRNANLIDNLPPGCCVEVPITASKRGLDPLHVGSLPDHLAVINNVSSRIEELAVRASLKGDPRMVFHAICMDPLTSAVLSLAEIHSMTEEMFQLNRDWLPQFRHAR